MFPSRGPTPLIGLFFSLQKGLSFKRGTTVIQYKNMSWRYLKPRLFSKHIFELKIFHDFLSTLSLDICTVIFFQDLYDFFCCNKIRSLKNKGTTFFFFRFTIYLVNMTVEYHFLSDYNCISLLKKKLLKYINLRYLCHLKEVVHF